MTIDGAALRVRAGVAAFVRPSADGGWRRARSRRPASAPGAEGPIADAVSGAAYLRVRTADHRAAEAEWQRAARWPSAPPIGPRRAARAGADLPVKADARGDRRRYRGTPTWCSSAPRETNSLIARFAGSLPLALNPGAADYGLLFIAPVGKHYALVSSGLPWWTGADEANRGGDRFAPPPLPPADHLRRLHSLQRSLANVVAEGHFDRNWKVPPDAAAKMLATGTVTIQT